MNPAGSAARNKTVIMFANLYFRDPISAQDHSEYSRGAFLHWNDERGVSKSTPSGNFLSGIQNRRHVVEGEINEYTHSQRQATLI
jgi:hypothetical protein